MLTGNETDWSLTAVDNLSMQPHHAFGCVVLARKSQDIDAVKQIKGTCGAASGCFYA